MKVKRFNNLWTMGLIIFGALLVGFYVLKIICPQFIVGVAEIPSIVKFGNFVDSHLWAYYLFVFPISYLIGYFYCCSCCRKKKLDLYDNLILTLEIIICFISQKFFIDYYFEISFFCMLIMPTIMCWRDNGENKNDKKYLYSIVITFLIHTVSQILSLKIRDLAVRISFPNTATLNILLIDMFIWMLLLYNFYNYKENKNEHS